MNKLLLDGGIYNLDNSNINSEIDVLEDSTLNAINLKDVIDLNIKIEKNKTLNMYMFDYADLDKDINLYVEMDENSKFNLNVGFIACKKYNLHIINNLYGSNITSNVNIRGINERNGNVTVLMDGTVAGETSNNVLNEYAKVINKSDNSNVMIPNLLINTHDVIANHGVSIGVFNESELFYLMSKGIDERTSKKLIEEGFILSIMDRENRDKIKNILLGR